jgi:hypothetical protein
MNHKSTRVYNQSWTNEHHRAQSTNRGSEDRPVNVTVVNKIPETKASEESKDDDPIKTLKTEAVRSVLGSTDFVGGLILLGLAGLAVALFKAPGGGKQ